MGDDFLDSIGNFLGIDYTEEERKRDCYQRLYERIDDKKPIAENALSDSNSRFSQYGETGSPSGTDKVSSAYAKARGNFDEDYSSITSVMDREITDAATARSTAYRKYCYYRDQDN